MYGMPVLDVSGSLGATSGDSFVYCAPDDLDAHDALDELRLVRAYLSSPLALFVYDAMRYRMRFLEREAFDVLPDVRSLGLDGGSPTLDDDLARALELPDAAAALVADHHARMPFAVERDLSWTAQP